MAMTTAIFSQLRTPVAFSPSQNPNPFSCVLLRSCPCLQNEKSLPAASLPFVGRRRPLCRAAVRCSSGGHADYDHERVPRPRPQEIPWSKELANSVHLIGTVGAPVQIKHLSSGKTLAWTRLAVKKSATETTWVSLTFWDDLAQVAFQHVEKGNQVYVSGRLVSDTVGEDDKKQVYYKVVVQQLNFVERSFPAVSLYEPEANTVASGSKLGSYMGNTSGPTEELWQAFFANPMEWWDNRQNKRSPKHPDFKHKHTGEALWIDAKYTPHWVKSQLEVLDSRIGSLQSNGRSSSVSFVRGEDMLSF